MKKLAFTCILMAALAATGCSSNSAPSEVTPAETPAAETTSNEGASTDAPSLEDSNIVEERSATTADEAIALLKAGNEHFLNNDSELVNISSERRIDLEDGQAPYAVVISCSDSRVSPSHLFNAGLGEIFEIRVAGNVLDDMAMGSVEYGAEHLGCPVIVVMGHESCGAVTATYDAITQNQEVEGLISTIVEEIRPSIEATNASSVEDAAHVNVENVIADIEANEIVSHLISEGKTKVVGAYYTLDGKVTFLED